jgi:hypothetical protein
VKEYHFSSGWMGVLPWRQVAEGITASARGKPNDLSLVMQDEVSTHAGVEAAEGVDEVRRGVPAKTTG